MRFDAPIQKTIQLSNPKNSRNSSVALSKDENRILKNKKLRAKSNKVICTCGFCNVSEFLAEI